MRRLVFGFALKHSERALNKDHIFTKINTFGIQGVEEFVSSSEQMERNVALHHLLSIGSSAVNGCRQNESPNS